MGVVDVIEHVSSMSQADRLVVLRSLLSRYSASTAGSPSVDAYPTGYVIYASDKNTQHCNSWILAPGTNLLSPALLGFLYFVGLVYVFLGIAIISDIFMAAIEVITAAEGTKRYRNSEGRMIEYRYKLVNPTVANLTLMALGSSAPEILLSIIGVIATLDEEPDKLGPSTIVGSAAFNLLAITGICIGSLPDGETKRIQDLGVFCTTALFSLLAYVWLYIVLAVSSPEVVEIWEAFVTFGLFGVLLFVAYLIDVRGKCCKPPSNVQPDDERSMDRSMSRPASAKELMTELQRTKEMERARNMPSAEVADTQMTGYVPLRTQALRGLTGQRRLHSHTDLHADDDETATHVSADASIKLGRSTSGESYRMRVNSPGDAQPADKVTAAKAAGSPKSPAAKRASDEAAAPAVGRDTPPSTGGTGTTPQPAHGQVSAEVRSATSKGDRGISGGNAAASAGDISTELSWVGSGPGEVHFEEKAVLCEEAIGTVKLAVVRTNGAEGTLVVSFKTRNGTATAGTDYHAAEGVLTFGPGETRKEVEVAIVDDDKPEPDTTFYVDLSATEANVLSSRHRTCAVTILDDDSWQERMRRLQTQLRNAMAQSFYSSDLWIDRFRDALELSGGVDEETGEDLPPSSFDTIMHALSLFWKVQFAFVPPESWYMGFPAFFVSLGFIGFWTAVVGEMASLFGCVVGLGDLVTAITFVALGTSLPDTFASRLATLHDEYADAAIGNITGSNSVNVFLGLGIPWIIGALYHNFAPTGKGQYDVPATSLGFTVAIFCTVACVALGTLLLRRALTGGELGGRHITARPLSVFFFMLWLLYILLASLADRGVYSGF